MAESAMTSGSHPRDHGVLPSDVILPEGCLSPCVLYVQEDLAVAFFRWRAHSVAASACSAASAAHIRLNEQAASARCLVVQLTKALDNSSHHAIAAEQAKLQAHEAREALQQLLSTQEQLVQRMEVLQEQHEGSLTTIHFLEGELQQSKQLHADVLAKRTADIDRLHAELAQAQEHAENQTACMTRLRQKVCVASCTLRRWDTQLTACYVLCPMRCTTPAMTHAQPNC